MTKFSVLLSVYKDDNADHLECALRSIWHLQTVKPSQIVIVKDGQLTDSLESVISGIKHELAGVVTEVSLKQNIGLAGALNVGLKACRYQLVARMDSDDISVPNRFERQ